MKVRLATQHDVPELLAIKQALRFAGSSRGGFLLGCDEAGYRAGVDEGRVWVLEARTEVRGFAVTMGSATFSKSPLWQLRHQVRFRSPTAYELDEDVGYFDQLAVRHGTAARASALLAFIALWNLLATDRHVVTTTVMAPVRNQAAVPLIELIGGVCVGDLDEVYPEFGRLTSAIWLISADGARERLRLALNRTRPDVLSAVATVAARTLAADVTTLLESSSRR